MTSARERAVEAGARAFMSVYKDPCADPSDYYDEVRATISAAFPIRAEELVAWHDEQIPDLESQIRENDAYLARSGLPSSGANDRCRDQINWHQHAASRLRARIQQMAEAEHE